MSLKAVELQIAIPKTFDAGKIADNHQQNVIGQQINSNEALKKEIERKRLLVNESEHLDSINDEENREQNEGQQDQDARDNEKKKTLIKGTPAKHPFKGNLFDYSG